MNLDRDFFQVNKLLSEDQKKKVFSGNETLFFPELKKGFHQEWNTFFPRIQVQTCAQMHTRVKLLEGITQSVGGDTLKIFGGDISLLPPEFRHHCVPRSSFLFLLGSAMEQNTFFSADKKVCALRKQKDLPIIKTPCNTARILWENFGEFFPELIVTKYDANPNFHNAKTITPYAKAGAVALWRRIRIIRQTNQTDEITSKVNLSLWSG